MNLSKLVKTDRIRPDGSGYTVTAGTSDVNSDIIDTAGFEGIRIITGFGAIVSGAATSVKAQQNTANSGTGMADLAGTSITVGDTDDNKVTIVEIYRPQERYIRQVTKRASQNATIDFMIVEYYGAKKQPITEGTNVISAEVSTSPAEGTA